MKKIVHLTSAHRRYDQRILCRECCSLRTNGYDVTLVVNDENEDETLENGIKILSTGFKPMNRYQRMTEGVKQVYRRGLAVDGEIYHLHDAELLTIALDLKRKGKKVIFDSHETYGEVIRGRGWIPKPLRLVMSRSYNFYETYVCKRIDAVIHIAKYDGKDWFAERSKRFVYVGNYPRVDEYKNIQILPYATRRGLIYSGGVNEESGIMNVFHAAKKINTKLTIAGRVDSEKIYEKIKEEDVLDIVDYVGMLNRKELYEYYAVCAIGIGISLDTGGQVRRVGYFNTKIYEYMAMEMPVILSDWPYRREMVEKYHFGLLVNPDDVDDIASKIEWLLEHPKEAEDMGKNGKHLLEQQFTWNIAERELIKIYKKIE